MNQNLITFLLVLVTHCLLNTPETNAAGAGRAFPVESENFAIEKFKIVNSQVEWDPTNFLIDLSGHYANCDYLNRKGDKIVADRKTPEGGTVVILIDVIQGKASDVDAVNGYLRDMITRWVSDRQYTNQIKQARRVGCSVRPACSGSAVVACVFSDSDGTGDRNKGDNGRGQELVQRPTQFVPAPTRAQELRSTRYVPRSTDKPFDEQSRTEPAFKQNALAFTPDQYSSAETIMKKKWDRSHYMENLSGYETDCTMIGTNEWPFRKALTIARDQGGSHGAITGQYGYYPNEGSTQAALEEILKKFKSASNAKNIGCSIIPDCKTTDNKMYVVISCLYEDAH